MAKNYDSDELIQDYQNQIKQIQTKIDQLDKIKVLLEDIKDINLKNAIDFLKDSNDCFKEGYSIDYESCYEDKIEELKKDIKEYQKELKNTYIKNIEKQKSNLEKEKGKLESLIRLERKAQSD